MSLSLHFSKLVCFCIPRSQAGPGDLKKTENNVEKNKHKFWEYCRCVDTQWVGVFRVGSLTLYKHLDISSQRFPGQSWMLSFTGNVGQVVTSVRSEPQYRCHCLPVWQTAFVFTVFSASWNTETYFNTEPWYDDTWKHFIFQHTQYQAAVSKKIVSSNCVSE